MAVDRCTALVRPLVYHRFSSLRRLKYVVGSVATVCVAVTTASFATGSTTARLLLVGWPFCAPVWTIQGGVDYVIIALVQAGFIIGCIAFVTCNVALVRILCQYQVYIIFIYLIYILVKKHIIRYNYSPTRIFYYFPGCNY